MARKRIKRAVVLELLKKGAFTTADLFVNALLEPFRHSYRGFPAPLRGKNFSIRDALKQWAEDIKERRRFYNLLISLKREGFISKDSSNKNSGWVLSRRGKIELTKILKSPERRYERCISKDVTVFSYDIPERYRTDRDWLRSTLKLLDFKMLHQSVWIGKIKIPEAFLTDIHERKITHFVHMFTIGKSGSLTQVL